MRIRFDSRAARPSATGAAAAIALLTACAGGGGPETMPSPAAAVETVTAASFTGDQVERGRELFGMLCGECHSTGEFRGQNFQFTWRRRTAWDFYRTISTTMPESAPGSLTDEEYVEVISYVLQMNGFVPGDGKLVPTEAALEHFVMDAPPNQ